MKRQYVWVCPLGCHDGNRAYLYRNRHKPKPSPKGKAIRLGRQHLKRTHGRTDIEPKIKEVKL